MVYEFHDNQYGASRRKKRGTKTLLGNKISLKSFLPSHDIGNKSQIRPDMKLKLQNSDAGKKVSINKPLISFFDRFKVVFSYKYVEILRNHCRKGNNAFKTGKSCTQNQNYEIPDNCTTSHAKIVPFCKEKPLLSQNLSYNEYNFDSQDVPNQKQDPNPICREDKIDSQNFTSEKNVQDSQKSGKAKIFASSVESNMLVKSCYEIISDQKIGFEFAKSIESINNDKKLSNSQCFSETESQNVSQVSKTDKTPSFTSLNTIKDFEEGEIIIKNDKRDIYNMNYSEKLKKTKNIALERTKSFNNPDIQKNKKIKKESVKKPRILSQGKLFGILVFLINLLVKTYRIETGKFVVWDEAHFGKFGSKYLKHEFYFDVHPPLGKMLTALSGLISGQDPNFKFESGSAYPDSVDYANMRRIHALIGSGVAVLAYAALRELGRSPKSAALTGMLFVFENGLTSVCRLILLDSHLLLFTAFAAYGIARSLRRGRSFDDLILGTALGCVCGVKWAGFLTACLAGLPVACSLISRFLSNRPLIAVICLFLRRALFLIMVPAVLYTSFFVVHLRWASGSGADDGSMSSAFQAGLRGSPLARTRASVPFGAVVSLRCVRPGGGCLHSHTATYPLRSTNEKIQELENTNLPVPSNRNSVNINSKNLVHGKRSKEAVKNSSQNDADLKGLNYEETSFKDEHSPADEKVIKSEETNSKIGDGPDSEKTNNDRDSAKNTRDRTRNFESSRFNNSEAQQITSYGHRDSNNHWAFQKVVDPGQVANTLTNGDEIVLLHVQTRQYLSGSSIPAPITPGAFRVQGSKVLTPACVWLVETVYDTFGLTELHAISTHFRLRHRQTGLLLSSTGKALPAWGFSQGEVALLNTNHGTLWNVEENTLPPGETEGLHTLLQSQSARFKHAFLELNAAMHRTNSQLVQDPNLEPARIVSRPSEWPLIHRGLRMNAWENNLPKFYMFGNPIVWYTAAVCVVIAPLVVAVEYVRFRRGAGPRVRRRDVYLVYIASGGWVIHYLPYFFFKRVLYFHHYMPALFFSIFAIDYMIHKLRIHTRIYTLFVIVVILSYILFAPMTYGILGDPNNLHFRQWRSTWDFK